MNSRKYARTLNEAFGPYSSGPIHPMPEPRRAQDMALYIVSVIALAVIVGASFLY